MQEGKSKKIPFFQKSARTPGFSGLFCPAAATAGGLRGGFRGGLCPGSPPREAHAGLAARLRLQKRRDRTAADHPAVAVDLDSRERATARSDRGLFLVIDQPQHGAVRASLDRRHHVLHGHVVRKRIRHRNHAPIVSQGLSKSNCPHRRARRIRTTGAGLSTPRLAREYRGILQCSTGGGSYRIIVYCCSRIQ
jgi:hypothetical protein